ncbi:hypothetical protein GCM10010279_33130 [Streptomyces mutabilis]|nr:hypothetical protein GCM10010279_33130 [Streptomyces mutabilis]
MPDAIDTPSLASNAASRSAPSQSTNSSRTTPGTRTGEADRQPMRLTWAETPMSRPVTWALTIGIGESTPNSATLCRSRPDCR